MENIQVTKDQFIKLLKVFYIGEWVINAHRIEDKVKDFEEIEQLLYKKAEELGFTDLIIKEPDEPYYPSAKLEFDEDIRNYIDENDDETFWSELSFRFSDKLALQKFTIEEIQNMSRDKRFFLLTNLQEELNEEFYKNGLDNLNLTTSEEIINNSTTSLPE